MIKFKNYVNAYLAILMESSLHEFNKGNKIPYIKKPLYLPKMKAEFKNALKNSHWIKDNEKINFLYLENNVINESPGSIEYPGTLCDKIFSIENYKNLSNDEVLTYINKDWKYFHELKNHGKTIKIFKFDFSNENDIRENFHILNLDKNTLNEYVNEFLKNQDSNGAFIPLGFDMALFIFNTKNYSKKTILHEFTHYIQHLLNVEKANVKKNIDIEKIKFLKLSKNNIDTIIDILKNEYEIIPYVNEFCEDVMNVYNKYYKNKNNELQFGNNIFIEYFINKLLNSNNIIKENLFKMYKECSADLTPLYITLCCFIYEIDLEKVKHILFKENVWKN